MSNVSVISDNCDLTDALAGAGRPSDIFPTLNEPHFDTTRDRLRMMHGWRRQGSGVAVASRSAIRGLPLHLSWPECLGVSSSKASSRRVCSLEFAWLLGLHAAIRRSPAGDTPRPLRLRLLPQKAEELAARLESFEGRRPTLRRVGDRIDVFYGYSDFSEYLFEISDGNRQVPWEHLATREERIEFLKAFVSRRACLSLNSSQRPTLALSKPMCPSLRKDVVTLFASVGIYPGLGNTRIHVKARNELLNIVDCGLLESEEKEQALTRAILRTPASSLCAELDQYYSVMRGECLTTLSSETRRRWRKGERPRVVRRFERIAAMALERPDPDATGYLFRALGLSSAEARRVASKRSLREVLTNIRTLDCGLPHTPQWAPWLEISPPDLEVMLGRGGSGTWLEASGGRYLLKPEARLRYIRAYDLQPREVGDFDLCLAHIRDELAIALTNAPQRARSRPNWFSSDNLTFNLQGSEIRSISLVGRARA